MGGDTALDRQPALLTALRQCKRPGCKTDFRPRAANQLYCSTECRRAHDRLLTRRGRAIIEPMMEHAEHKGARPGTDRAERASDARRFAYQALREFRDEDRAANARGEP